MKTFVLPSKKIALLFFITPFSIGAQIKMGEHPLEINPNAIFEIESRNQGVLLSRMTSSERDIAFNKEAPNGLLIFNLTHNRFEFFDAFKKAWIPLLTQIPKLSFQNNQLIFEESTVLDLNPYLDNTDAQQLHLEGSILRLDHGGTVDLSRLISNTEHQQLRLEDTTLILENGGSVDLSPLFSVSKDEQKLSLTNSILSLERGGSVDLSNLFVPTPPQTIDHFQLVSNTLEISLSGDDQAPHQLHLDSFSKDEQKLSLTNSILSLERGGSVDLGNLFVPTPPQTIDHFQLISNTLEISLSGDEEAPHQLHLDSFSKDEQQLPFDGITLSLENGGQIDLSSLLDNTDEQKMSLSNPNSNTLILELSKGNAITLKSSGSLTFYQTSSDTIAVNASQSPFVNDQNLTSNKHQNWETDDFVFGSPQLNNDPSTTEDNKRFFYDKSKGAFRAGIAQSDQWDEKNIGTYSIAMGRNTIASGYHSTAFGLSTESKAWYAITMGQGTVAESRSETVIGSYNSLYTPKGGTRDWEATDRLFVLGNGTGSSTASRTDALIIYKNGDALANGNWTGSSFNKISDEKLKVNIKSISSDLNKLLALKPRQFEYKNDPHTIQYGFVAQELEKIYPELVQRIPGSNHLKSIDYMGLLPLLVEAIQKQQTEIDYLMRQIQTKQ